MLASPYYNTFNQRTLGQGHAQQLPPRHENSASPADSSPSYGRPPPPLDQYTTAPGPALTAADWTSSPNPHKRRRIQEEAAEDMPHLKRSGHAHVDRVATPGANGSSTLLAENDDTRRREYQIPHHPPEELSRPQGMASISTSSNRVIPSWPPPQEERGHSHDSGSCSTCDRASNVAPQIARGLETLHGQLKMVIARDQQPPRVRTKTRRLAPSPC